MRIQKKISGGSRFRPGWVQQSFTIILRPIPLKIEGGPHPRSPPLDPRMVLMVRTLFSIILTIVKHQKRGGN